MMRSLFKTRIARWFFNRYFGIPIDATVVQIGKDNIHFTHDFETFKCRQWQISLADFPVLKRIQTIATIPLAFFTKGFAFLLLTDTTATNDGDTQLFNAAPTTNYGSGTSNWASCDNGGQFHHLIKFTLPSGSGTISSITLNLYKVANGGTDTSTRVEVHEMTQTWVESEATWNEYSSGNSWSTAGGDYSATVVDDLAHTASNNITRTWDLGTGATNPIAGLTWESTVDLMLIVTPESTTPQQAENYNSKEAASNKPYIEITYTAATFIPKTIIF